MKYAHCIKLCLHIHNVTCATYHKTGSWHVLSREKSCLRTNDNWATDVFMHSGERRKFIQFRVVTRSWGLWELTKGEEDRRVGARLTGHQCRAWLETINFKLIHVFLKLRYKWCCSKRRKISFTLKKNPKSSQKKKKGLHVEFLFNRQQLTLKFIYYYIIAIVSVRLSWHP